MAREKRPVVVAGEEARLLALGALRGLEPCTLGLGPRGRLVLVAEREPDAVELPRVEPGEHVRLVLRRIGAAREQRPPAMLDDARVVPCCEPVAAGAARERE